MAAPDTGSGTPAAALVFQPVSVEVPILLEPFAQLGPVHAECCGAPAVLACQVYQTTAGVSCTVRIAQTLRLDIPVAFGATACAGETSLCDCSELRTQ